MIVKRSILLSLLDCGRKITFWDKIDNKYRLAILLPKEEAARAGAIIHEWTD
jgi:hypothetical protein